ncbi:ATP-dependent exonuclase V beta subunit, helicase and exonuclease domain-containing [Terriglobus roseus DSM 18391]|uniref:DNA 3'-5' helicase n=1 Tax=Terriglobus roseus (strain DSM 18391 / NRRL B-41598 / KBS 63) TaxID=926566 RepID=I3ZEK7_TERRK|nr:UvrD-helicase domain-containing protein [Terriglobus roseus]AFL87675.1 ATP-dependent exonuclase V beta subunit, helicase and exonuclease domain-containing [Terriglobus roseus DSM 18391]
MVIEFPVSDREEMSDASERSAALDITTSCIVEAPAGSGKTGLLIQRFLKLLATVDEPAQVLALTFTNKATAEMQERVLGALSATADGSAKDDGDFARLTKELAEAVLARDAERGWRLLQRPQRLNIRTIDSLCGEIARSLPLLSGEAGVTRPVQDARPLYARAARVVMMQFGGNDEPLNAAVRTVLLHRDGDLLFCERVLAEMLGTREQWGSLIPLGEQLTEEHLEQVTLPRLNASLERVVCGAMEELRDSFDEESLLEIAAITEQLAYADGYKDYPHPFRECGGMPLPPGCGPDQLRYWKAIAHALLTKDGWRASHNTNHVYAVIETKAKARLKDLIESIQSDELKDLLNTVRGFEGAVYPREQWEVAKALFRLLERALVELQLLFAREGVCDFTEVALAARTALKENAFEAQSALGAPLRHLLVDEMQDTSSGQYELLQTLTSGWDGASQTVCLVGDPKQSIYLFRQARVDRFQRCMTTGLLGEIGLNVLRLSSNFRSTRTLVDELNGAFTRIFPEHHPLEGDVEFHPATAAKDPVDGDGAQWHLKAVPPGDGLMENRRVRRRAVREEARAIASTILRWRAEKGESSSVAVLTRARTHVTEIAKALRKVGVPYRAVDLESLAERQEVLDIMAVTRALLHPADRVAWVALLRAPWCGVELAHLHTLVAGDDRQHRSEALRLRLRERAAMLPGAAGARVLRTLDVMDGAVRHAGTAALADRVDRTWRSLGGDLCTDDVGRENVRQFLRVLDAMEADGEAVTLPSLNRRVERLFAQAGHAANAVDIMTVHRAKGLEWDLVIVPGLHRPAGRDAFTALEWLEIANSDDVLLAPLPAKGGQAEAVLQYIRKRRRERVYLELKRLFYVAATRARVSLHLYGAPMADSKGSPIVVKGTLLSAARPAAMLEFQTAAGIPVEEAPTRGIALVDEQDTFETGALALAASIAVEDEEEKVFHLPSFQRLPDHVDPIASLHASQPAVASLSADALAPRQRFVRPQGTFGARAVGNAIHAFVERLSQAVAGSIGSGEAANNALGRMEREVPQWSAAIHAMLRSGGLPPAAVERAAGTVERALLNMLRSEDGRWLLLPHRMAANEAAWRSGVSGEEVRVRLDRSFFAGSKPGAAGDDTLWIVDFKTADRAAAEQDAFLAEERVAYEQQLRAYAAIRLQMLPAGTPVMLALFYPLMGRMVSWRYEASEVASSEVVIVANGTGQFSLFG